MDDNDRRENPKMAEKEATELLPLTMAENGAQPHSGENYPRLVDFEDQFRDPEKHKPATERLSKAFRRRVGNCSAKKYVLGLFPLVDTLRGYKISDDLPNDLIAGVTAGVMMIPQGMAFAALSTLPPIVGLYISFFASVAYAILGTGRQVSWGCIAVLSIMMGAILDKYDNSMSSGSSLTCLNGTVVTETAASLHGLSMIPNETQINATAGSDISTVTSVPAVSSNDKISSDPSDPVTARRMEIASGVSVVAGVIVIAASRLGLSRVSYLLSNSLITGFTVGIAFHVFTSQLKELFGVSVPRYSGILGIIYTWIDVAKKLPETNVATLLTSTICILVIYLVKRFINERYKEKLRIPIPVDLLVAIAATLVIQFAKVHEDHGVKVVGVVPVGLPAPRFPNLSMSASYIGDGLVIAIVAYTQTLAVAKTFGLEHGYPVDAGQEMLASGLVHLICGVFSGYIAAGSVSRSMVQNSAGGRTQLASLVAALMVLLVILFAGPYFYYLPKCVLSAIIVVSLRSMFLKLLTIPEAWRKSPVDCTVWVFACASTVVLGPDYGILVSVLVSLVLVVLQAAIKPVVEAGQIRSGENLSELTLRSIKAYTSARTLNGVRIIKIKTPLFFVNSESFVEDVYEKTGIYPMKIKKEREQAVKNGEQLIDSEMHKAHDGANSWKQVEEHEENSGNLHSAEYGALKTSNGRSPHEKCSILILDAAQVVFIDLMGVQALQSLIKEMTSVGVDVYITSVPESVIPTLKSTGFWKKNGDRLFMSIDAVLKSLSM